MNTNNHYNKDDLFHSLPDYISSNVGDKNLISEIEKEIQQNPEYKREYENMKHTFGFLKSVEPEGPGESYFNNLSVRINERVSRKSIWEEISLFWKILVPVISIIIIAILLYNNSGSDKTKNQITDNKNTKVETKEKIDGAQNNKVETKEKINESQNSKVNTSQKETVTLTGDKNPELHTISKSRNAKEKFGETLKSKDGIVNFDDLSVNVGHVKADDNFLSPSNSIVENTDEIVSPENEDDLLYINDSEDDDYEDEFLKLPPEEQREILKDLNKSQI
ncbi:MAG: hypothetical protein ABI462_12645 [Ignavibacteria bacterium]